MNNNLSVIFNDKETLLLIQNYAEHNELTVDYVIEEFVIDGTFTPVFDNE